ncbi:hybrid sensor histidine kinase/response regulator [Parasphingopyxis marina]|uniref:histidine kinase n=1 Tax=Parasphingopyxis marina TaxID=2761622 RepID=A0A842I1S5_9SPHN|nr:PAS domain S-box protein [Parasphingopyxis marina]MBC2778663.1 PAS domain S-box protein [Parasphingopyxis marina]
MSRFFCNPFSVPTDQPDLLIAQAKAFTRQIPLMHVVLLANTLALSLTHLSVAPPLLAATPPALMAVICLSRTFDWWRLRHTEIDAALAERKLKRTIWTTLALALAFPSWALALLPYGDAYQQGHVVFFLGLTILACIFCMIYLRGAAILTALIGLPPFVGYLALSSAPVFQAIAVNMTMIGIMTIFIALRQNREFANLVASRRDLASQAAQAEALSAELRRSNTELQMILDNIPLHIFYKDDKNRILRLNKAAAHMFGKPVEEIEGRSTYDLLPHKAKEVHKDDLEVIESGRPRLGQVDVNILPDGSETWLRIDKVPYVDPVSGERFVFAAVTDMTAERLAWDGLRANEERYRSLYNNAPVMMHSIGPDYRIQNVSDLWLETLGYAREEVVGKPATKFMAAETAKKIVQEWRPAFLRGAPIKEIEMQFVKKSGETLDVLASGSPQHDEEGKIVGGLAVLIDITERKAIENQLLQAQKMESVGQLTGGMAHDFNNLLGVIMGNLELVERSISGDPATQRRLAAASMAAERGAELTRRLLAFSRQQKLEIETVSPGAMVSDIEHLLRRTLGENIVLDCQFDANLPPICADRVQLESAILNLAVNARDAMPDGGTLAIKGETVTLDTDFGSPDLPVDPGDYVMIAVSDTGTGIPEDVLAKVFEPFFTTKETGKGSGLGLSMVYGFMKQSGGQIRIASRAGRGTAVRLYLPVAREAVEAAETRARYESQTRVPQETILVVEDQPDLRAVAVENLEHLGYRVIEAENGVSGLQRLITHPEIDLLFTDVVMPGGIDGTKLAEAAAALRPDLPIVFTTGFAGHSMFNEKALEAHRNVLMKPYPLASLAEKIMAALHPQEGRRSRAA